MKSKIITSLLAGLIIPWSYFLFVRGGSVRTYTADGERSVGDSGIAGFIQFYGLQDSLIAYGKAGAICALMAFAVCLANGAIERTLGTNP